jgi:hypothetical protein
MREEKLLSEVRNWLDLNAWESFFIEKEENSFINLL